MSIRLPRKPDGWDVERDRAPYRKPHAPGFFTREAFLLLTGRDPEGRDDEYTRALLERREDIIRACKRAEEQAPAAPDEGAPEGTESAGGRPRRKGGDRR